MSECRGEFLLLNGKRLECGSVESALFYPADSVYEVIRVIRGVPLFLEDHISRLHRSLELKQKERQVAGEEISELVRLVGSINKLREGNIKVTIGFAPGGTYTLVHLIESVYPGEELYSRGIDTVLYNAVRENPGAKVSNFSLRAQIYDKLVRSNAYEALLVDDNERVTEGSKSNVFMVKGGRLVTAPDEEVLCGITRKYVLKLCSESGIRVELRSPPVGELMQADALFITGTSPMVLAVRSVDGREFMVDNPLVSRVSALYREAVETYVTARQQGDHDKSW